MASMLSLFVLCVVFAVIDARVIRTDRVEVPPEGMTLKIVIKPDRDGKMKVQVKSVEKERKRTEEKPFKIHGFVRNKAVDEGIADLPSIGNRFGIKGGVCQEGYVLKSGFCFPDYD